MPKPRDISDSQVEEIAREYELAGTTTDKLSGGLFGDLDSEESLVMQRAELKSFLRKEFAAERNTFKAVSTKGRVSRISEEGGNTLDVAANKERADAADAALWAFNQLANRKGDVSGAIQSAAEDYYHEPRKRKNIFASLKRAILERIDLNTGGLRPDDAERGGNAAVGNPGAGDGQPGSAGDTGGGTREHFAREFARRGFGGIERYSAVIGQHVDVIEQTGKISKLDANYRPAFGGPRCAACEFFRAGKCAQVHGTVRAEDFCDLYFPRRTD